MDTHKAAPRRTLGLGIAVLLAVLIGLLVALVAGEPRGGWRIAAFIGLALGAALGFGGAVLLLRRNAPAVGPVERREAQLRALADHTPDALVIVDEQKRIVMTNAELLEAFGYESEQELLGRSINVLVPERFHAAMDGVDTRSIRHGSRLGRGIGLQVLRKDGSEFPVDVIVGPIHTDEGLFITVALRDVTQRHEQQRELQQSEERFRSLLEAAPDAIVVVNEQREMQLVNRRVEEMFGYSREQLLGRPTSMLIPERLRESFFSGPGRDLQPGSSIQEIQLFGLRSDGSEFPLELDRGVFRSDEGVQIFAIVRDVTERRRAAAELEAAREAAESANRAKSVFLANMSHELRTPMNAILGYSEMLMEEAADDGQEDTASDLKKIHQSGAHLLSLINDVLDLAKIESGKMEALAEDFEVGSLLDDVSATAQPLMGKNDNQLEIERGDALGTARQDLTKLRQSLLNLLSNAAKFTHEGTVTLSAERSVRGGADWLTLSVRDSGIGIPADKHEQVFEEFGQAEETTSRDYGGTGLGLPISRRFCRMLGGDLTLESRPGEGSTFTIHVPSLLAEGEEEARAVAEPARTDAELAAIRESAEGRTVLVIDDDAEARDIVERLLRKDDFEVVTAGSGEEGLRLAHRLEPAVITLDVMMPEMDGWSVLRALKADPVLRDIPVVMLTMLDEEAKGYSLGATDFLVKPVDRGQLRRVVSRYHAPEAPCTALLVDDDPAVRETLSSALSTAGWEVEQAENGREALARMASSPPTLILLDLMMPVMDGFDFLVELHANPEWREIPVLVLTAKDLTDEDRRVLSGRVEQILEKDAWSHERLADLVRKLGTRHPVPESPWESSDSR